MAENIEILSDESQVLPFSYEAEQAVLGAILIDPDVISEVAELIKPDYFYVPQHKAIANAVWAMDALSKRIDAITILEELKKDNVFDDAGGKAYLLQLAQIVPTSANASSYAKIIKEKHYIRSLILAARKIINDASTPDINADILLIDRVSHEICGISLFNESIFRISPSIFQEIFCPAMISSGSRTKFALKINDSS